MRTEVIEITRDIPEWHAVSRAAEVISSGGIVSFPTDTVYGLAASIFCEQAISDLRRIKDRRADEPFVVMVGDAGWVSELAAGITRTHRRLMAEHWPGPVTILFEASRAVPACLRGGADTIALRVPNDTLSQCVLGACGVPLAVPSANPRGRAPAVSAGEVLESFRGKIALLLDGGTIENAAPSTIAAVRSGRVVVMRAGRAQVAGRVP